MGAPDAASGRVRSTLVTTGRAGTPARARLRITEPFDTSVRRGTPLLWATGAGDDRSALLGWGERFRATASGPTRFADLAAAFRTFVTRTADVSANHHDLRDLLAFVTVTFAADSAAASTLIVPATLGRWHDGVLSVPGDAALPEPGESAEFPELDLRPGRLSREGFRRAVAAAVQRIGAGELDKVVLARDLEALAVDPLDVTAVLARLADANPNAWTFHIDGLLGASPEMLVAVRAGRVRSQVLAGSAPISGDPDADAAAEAALLRSTKDAAEHRYAAHSVAARLAAVADVTTDGPRIVRLPRIMHLATDIEGVLSAAHSSALDLAGLVHPSAAVCGTPTDAAATLLAELEGFDRGRYAGPVGWVDARGEGEFAIALRCGQLSPDACSVRLFAGGGIVAASVPNTELAETAQKFLPMYDALSPVARP